MSRLSKYKKLLRDMEKLKSSNQALKNRIDLAERSFKSSITVDQEPLLDDHIQMIKQYADEIKDLLTYSIIPDIESDIESLEEEEDDEWPF